MNLPQLLEFFNSNPITEGLNEGFRYKCDKCKVVDLIDSEFKYNWRLIYQGNSRVDYHYCDECWNFIHLKKWKCKVCKSTGSIRNERILPMNCGCGGKICLSK